MSADDSFAKLLESKLQTIPDEEPNKFIKYMYSTVHPGMLNLAIIDAKEMLERISNNSSEGTENTKLYNVYFTLGTEGLQQSLYNGALGALLWLQDYIDIAKTSFGCSDKEIEITKQVLRKINLPHITDVIVNPKTGEINSTSNCRHYAAFLGSFVQWLTTGTTSFKIDGPMRTNYEVCKFLTSLSLNSFPSIPFTAYYVGQVRTNDQMETSEQLSKIIDFSKYMTVESISVNQPKFVIQPVNAPLISITGHPLSDMVYGNTSSDGNIEWLGLFNESEEFAKVCANSGLSIKDVKKYIYQTSYDKHKQNLSNGDKIAMFINSQGFIKELFELRHSENETEDMSYDI